MFQVGTVFQIEVKVKQYKLIQLIQYNKFLVFENYQAFKASF